jgi:hypothetical protein
MVVDLNQLEITVTQLEADAIVLGKIVNDAPDAVNAGEENGTVTTRMGDVVKNARRSLDDIESASMGNFIFESITGTSYTLVAGDQRKYKRTINAAAVSLTIDGGVLSANDEVIVEQGAAGQVTIIQGSGMTLQSLSGNLVSAGQYGVIRIKFISASVATIYGDLIA